MTQTSIKETTVGGFKIVLMSLCRHSYYASVCVHINLCILYYLFKKKSINYCYYICSPKRHL